MADFETLYPGRFLKKEVLATPKVVRILAVTSTELESESGAKEPKVIVKYKAADGEGEIVWCKTNAVLTAEALGTREYNEWVGKLITIYNNPNVDLKGKKVGGIRVFGSPEMKTTKKVSIKRPRRKNPEVYELVPTDNKGKAVAGKKQEAAPSTDAPPLTDSDMPTFDDTTEIVNGEVVQ